MIASRYIYDHTNECSCLPLILVCAIYWPSPETSRIVAAPEFPFDPELIAPISPIEWPNPRSPKFPFTYPMLEIPSTFLYRTSRLQNSARKFRIRYKIPHLTEKSIPISVGT